MIKKNILFLTLLSYLNLFSYNNHDLNHQDHDTYNSYDKQYTTYIKKHLGIIACIPIILYYQKNILDTIINHPYISSCCFYFLLNYILDCTIQYNNIKSLLNLTDKLKKTALYLIIYHGIKNYIYEKNLPTKSFIQDQNFLKIKTKHNNYSFDQIEHTTIKIYKELKSYFESLTTPIYIESEEIAFLSYAQSIDTSILLYISKRNEALYQEIEQFIKNNENIYPLIYFLQTEITANFSFVENILLEQLQREI